jgi:hypothetical protein
MIEKSKLTDLYIKEGQSMSEVAINVGCSIHKVQYWMSRYGIKSRSKSDSLYLKNNPLGDPFNIKNKLSKSDLILLGMGLGLWWGEGSKKHKGTIRLGNTDPVLIKKFVEFLKVIFGVETRKIRYGLQVFSDMNVDDAKIFWMKHLNVKSDQFLAKVVITPSRGEGTYKNKVRYGVLTIYCANIKLRKLLDDFMIKYS